MANLISRFIFLKPTTVTKLLSSSRPFFTTASSPLSKLRSLSSRYALRPPRDSTVSALAIRTMSSSLDNPSSPAAPITKEINSPEERDLKHWLVFVSMRKRSHISREFMIEIYINTLAFVVGSEEEARMKIYSVSTKYYYAFGALLSDELARKLEDTDGVKRVVPDSYIYLENKEYKGEPFINGDAVPYDPKYHEAWVRINGDVPEDPDKEELPGMDGYHWYVLMEPPKRYLSRDEIIDSYIKTLAQLLGSEEEARRSIYWVSTRMTYAFGAFVGGFMVQWLSDLPGVISVSGDAYVDVENEKYGGEPFINGEAVPYDPKYHHPLDINYCPEFDWFNSNIGKDS